MTRYDWRVWALVIGLTLILAGVALAAEQKTSWTCSEVKQFVDANGGPENAEKVAREHGVPRWAIRWAKRCLK